MKMFLFLPFVSYFLNYPLIEIHGNEVYQEIRVQANAKTEAFKVLQTKCNACHSTKKRTDIFTLENMDSLAIDINKQVFIKQKMPKGKKVKLTEEEMLKLKSWLSENIGAEHSIDKE